MLRTPPFDFSLLHRLAPFDSGFAMLSLRSGHAQDCATSDITQITSKLSCSIAPQIPNSKHTNSTAVVTIEITIQTV
ncbi:MAG: hypothetical protein EA364_07720 [Balneolaceae bacterium]|nr:MAG: hypothetical protein EA364_07720 [Balneolaceae bacterium]